MIPPASGREHFRFDANDAMTSDRPYRAHMAAERVDRIFPKGKSRYWDPDIVEACFAGQDDIVRISRQERSRPTLDVEQRCQRCFRRSASPVAPGN